MKKTSSAVMSVLSPNLVPLEFSVVSPLVAKQQKFDVRLVCALDMLIAKLHQKLEVLVCVMYMSKLLETENSSCVSAYKFGYLYCCVIFPCSFPSTSGGFRCIFYSSVLFNGLICTSVVEQIC